jgi:hypothetical protein
MHRVDSRLRIAYDESVKGIDRQVSAVESLRSRTSTLLAAAALVTSFLGAQAVSTNHGSFQPWSYVAVTAFVGVATLAIFVLLPRKWDWSFGATNIIRDYVDGDNPADEDAMLRDLALHRDVDFDKNERRISTLMWLFRSSSFLLAVEVSAWLVDLAN